MSCGPNSILGTGNESVAVVEFAPFQKVPSEKKKVDGRMGTIEKGQPLLRDGVPCNS